jgi:predicted AAA+ superfamily ATPase
MKRKPAGSNHKAITKYLSENGAASAIDIRRATRVRGNIYLTMNKMVALGLVKKVGKLYVTANSPIDSEDTVEPQPEKFVPLTHPNQERIALLLDEIDYVRDGIETLETTLNYLDRRVQQLSEQRF